MVDAGRIQRSLLDRCPKRQTRRDYQGVPAADIVAEGPEQQVQQTPLREVDENTPQGQGCRREQRPRPVNMVQKQRGESERPHTASAALVARQWSRRCHHALSHPVVSLHPIAGTVGGAPTSPHRSGGSGANSGTVAVNTHQGGHSPSITAVNGICVTPPARGGRNVRSGRSGGRCGRKTL